jgi:GDPmannose 4,6-dehydratase
LEKEIRLGNTEAKRDWGHARDYVKAMWLMLQQSEPDDFVIATGKSHSVLEFLDLTFSYFDLNYEKYLVVEESLFRPSEVIILRGDASKAKKILGWQSEVSFEDLVREMVEHDFNYFKKFV